MEAAVTIPSEVLDFVASEETHPDRSVIVKEGGRGEWIYLVLEGRVKIQKRTAKGMLTIETLGPGSYLGEMTLLNRKSGTRSLSAVADGQVQLGTLDTARLFHEWGIQPARLRKLMATLTVNLDEAAQQLVNLVERTR
jgi:CRP-like cAMP-binding protein